MSYRKTTEDLNKLVGKLTSLVTDTFKCCIRNYEVVLPYLGKSETNSKIHHKLVKVNILLNKLNEELVGLRVEYGADSPYEQKWETDQSEGSRKRRLSDDVPEFDRYEAKSMKFEVSFSNSTKCSETGINIQSQNLVLNGTVETSNTEVQGKKNIKTEIQDSNDVEDTNKFSITNNKIPVTQKSCDTTNNGMTVHFADDEVSASVADRLVEDNPYDKSAITQRETNEVCVKLQSVKSETNCQEKCEDASNVISKDHDICRGKQKKIGCTTSASHQAKRPCDNNNTEWVLGLYGVKKHKKKSFKCTLCNCAVSDTRSLYIHVNGKKHQKKLLSANIVFSKMFEVPNNNCESTVAISVCSAAPGPLVDTVQSNKCESIQFVPASSVVSCSLSDSNESDSCESIEYISEPSAVSCSLADTVALVEDRHQLLSVKHAVRLDDIWTYFHPPFHINKKYIRFHSGKIICYLCYEEVRRNILSVRRHIARSSHRDRVNILRNIELESKSSNKQLLDVPGYLKNIIPATQFSLRNNSFYCNVCNCLCDNTVVLSHMTSESHGKKLDEIKKAV